MAYFTINVIDGSGNNALAQATQLVAPTSLSASANNTSWNDHRELDAQVLSQPASC